MPWPRPICSRARDNRGCLVNAVRGNGVHRPNRPVNVLPASDAFLFWSIAAAMTALALAFALARLIVRRAPPAGARRHATNVAIHRSELADLARERAEGRLSDEQYAQACEEIERRLLSDAAGDCVDVSPSVSPRGTAIVLVVALPLLAFGLYMLLGNPAALDGTPIAAPTTTGGPEGVSARRDQLIRHLARNARDGRGWMLLARMDFEADRFDDAADSYGKALAASPKIAADAGVWCEYADALGMAQGGTLAGRPRELVMRALTMNAAHPKALEMAGSAAFEAREFASAARYWRQLLAQLPESSVQHRELATAVTRAERLTSVADGSPDAPR
jgi:cytochrome c-type biogenesis protein CcmH